LDLLVDVRRQLRDAQQWELADRIRQGLAEQGIGLEDGKDGTRWVMG
jgi:cysteinyl-tRNA synthetase